MRAPVCVAWETRAGNLIGVHHSHDHGMQTLKKSSPQSSGCNHVNFIVFVFITRSDTYFVTSSVKIIFVLF